MPRTTLVLLPGLLNTRRVFEQQIEALSDFADCVVPELWHHDTIGAMAEAALALAPPTFALVGFSMGGYVAFEILRRATQRVERLALMDTQATPDSAESTKRRRALLEQTKIGRFHGVQRTLLPQLVHSRHINDATISQPIFDMAQEIGADGFVREQRAIIDRADSRRMLVDIDIPTVVIVGRPGPGDAAAALRGDGGRHRQLAAGRARGMRPHEPAGEARGSHRGIEEMVEPMNTVYAREDYLGADDYIDIVAKSGLNRPIEDRGRVERMLAHANLILTARQDGRLVGFARSLTDFCFCCYLSDLAVDKACQGQGIGKRLIEETRVHAGGDLTTTLLLSAPTAMTFYQGIKMPNADNCFLYRRKR